VVSKTLPFKGITKKEKNFLVFVEIIASDLSVWKLCAFPLLKKEHDRMARLPVKIWYLRTQSVGREYLSGND